MTGPVARPDAGGLLTPATRERFRARAAAAAARAARTGEPTLAAVTEEVELPLDPVAVTIGGRRAGESWGVVEQPDRDGSAVCALGSVLELGGDGAERFGNVSEEWQRLSRGAVADAIEGAPPGSGPIVFGGFSFDGRRRAAGCWREFGPASLTVPEISFARRSGSVSITLHVLAEPGIDPGPQVERLLERVAELPVGASLPEHMPSSLSPASIESALPPEHYESAVARALEAIDARRIEKVVLAREVLVERAVGFDPGAVIAMLRQVFPSCFVFAVGRGDGVMIGASPELLIRREGLHASTVALAGSAPRSADPAVDDHLGERLIRSVKDRAEQAIVTDRIAAGLEPVSVWVAAGDEPQLVKVANVQHLATPIRARLREPVAALDLVGCLHPTPAVGGEPWPEAAAVIAETEGLDRGWYASPIGWSDAGENGEFFVALRCALITGSEARAFAGVGVVAGSDPSAELAETELKLQAILPVLAD